MTGDEKWDRLKEILRLSITATEGLLNLTPEERGSHKAFKAVLNTMNNADNLDEEENNGKP